MTGNIESRLNDLGYELPSTVGDDYYGTLYGTMKPYHIVGPVLHLSGHVPISGGDPVFPWLALSNH